MTSMETGESAPSESLLSKKENEEVVINGDVDPAVLCAREPFPHLNTVSLSSEQVDELLGKLFHETMEIRFKFASLVTNLKMSLIHNKVGLEKVKDEAKYFGSCHREAIAAVDTAERAVGVMNESWNFCEFSMLEHMMMKFGSNEDRAELQAYKENLAEFSQRKVYECPEGIFGGSAKEDEVILMLKKNCANSIIPDVALSDVQNLCLELRKEISVDDCNMRLVSTGMEKQSLVLTFGITSSVLQRVSSLLEDYREKLISLGIWYAAYGEKVETFAISECDEVDGRMLGSTEQIRGMQPGFHLRGEGAGEVPPSPKATQLPPPPKKTAHFPPKSFCSPFRRIWLNGYVLQL